MSLARTNGISLHYELTGSGPPLCLIAGFRQNGDAWPHAFLDRLARRHRLLVFDNRGTGRSDKPDQEYDIGLLAGDVVHLLDAVGMGRAHLLGFSMGGAIAQQVAVSHPERIARLVLFGTFCGGVWSEPPSRAVWRILLSTAAMIPEQAARAMAPLTYSAGYLAANPDAVEQQIHRELAHPTPAFVARRQLDALRQFDTYRDLPAFRAETLVTTGAADLLVHPRNSRILASRIRGARLELLADLGHRAIWESPEEMAELIGDFLRT